MFLSPAALCPSAPPRLANPAPAGTEQMEAVLSTRAARVPWTTFVLRAPHYVPFQIRYAMINQPFGVRFRNLVDAYLIRPSAGPSITAFNARYFFNEYPLITRISAGFKGHSWLQLSLTAAVTRRQMFIWPIPPPQHSSYYRR